MTAFSHITFFYSLRGANHQIMDKKETGFAEYKFSHKFSHKINKTIPKQETEFGKKKIRETRSYIHSSLFKIWDKESRNNQTMNG